jgi:hypothetical protein
MTLREKQSAFCLALANLIVWAYDRGYEFTMGEGYVGDTDARDGDHDGPHLRAGMHYKRLAQDLNLFINGEWIRDGDHPAWTEIGVKWESMDSMARWGGRFSNPDANHFSFTEGGRA